MTRNVRKFISILTFVFAVSGACLASSLPESDKQPERGKKVDIPMNKPKFKSDKTYYRVVQSGVSSDILTAKKIALMNAKNEMKSEMLSFMQAVNAEYMSRYRPANPDYEAVFDENLDQSIQQELDYAKVIKEEAYLQKSLNLYTYWICLRQNRTKLTERLVVRLAQDERIGTGFSREGFMKVFREETARRYR